MISIKDYALSHGVSYEAVRKQVAQYKDELGGHIVVQHRTKYLDDEAVAFLDEHRAQSAVSVLIDDRKNQMAELEEENKQLMKEVARLQAEGNGFRDQIIALLQEKQTYLEDRGRVALLLEQHEQQGKDLEKALEDLAESRKETARAREDRMDLMQKLQDQQKESESLQGWVLKSEAAAEEAAREAEDLRRQLQEAQERTDRLMKRSLWDRITNREA